jgi:hypothetical protein
VNRTASLNLRLTRDEKRAIVRAAKRAKTSPSGWIRRALLGAAIVDAAVLDAMKACRKHRRERTPDAPLEMGVRREFAVSHDSSPYEIARRLRETYCRG